MELAIRNRAGRFMLYRDAALAILGLYTAAEVPLRIVYGEPGGGAALIFDVAVSFVFAVAIFFRPEAQAVSTGAPADSGQMHHRRFRKETMLDFLAAVPFELVGVLFPGASAGVYLLRLFSLVRVSRISAFTKRREISMHTDRGGIRLFIFLFWCMVVAHVVTCGWLYLGGGNIDPTLGSPAKYARAFYWCITTLATVGYGDITPTTIPQTIYATAVMLLGVAIYGYVISSVINLITNMNVARSQYIKTMDRVNAFATYNNLPPPLRNRIHNYHEYLYESRLGYSESEALAELPASLQSDVALYLHRDLLSKVPVFRNASENVIREIVLRLQAQVVPPGDYVFHAGDEGEEMYFIRRGTVDVVSADGSTVFATLSDGAFFGEVALLARQPRNAGIRARGYVDLYMLHASAVERVMKRYPDFAAQLSSIAESRKGADSR